LTTQRAAWRRVTLAAGAIAAVLSSTLGAPSAAAQDLNQDHFDTSPNVTQVANVPATLPLKDNGARGTDIAFTGDYAIVGNYNGLAIYNIKHPKQPTIVSQVLCPGSQGDVSVHGNLLFYSVDSRRSDDSCNSVAQNDGTLPYWEGVRIFDISDKANPKYIKSVETQCGSHTHTLVPAKTKDTVYLYVSSYAPATTITNCQPPHDKISVIKVPVNNPTAAAVESTPVVFPEGGNPGTPGNFPDHHNRETSGCHDITALPQKDIAAGACMGDGVIFDISDRGNPKVIEVVQDKERFAFWHSASFSNDAKKVIFTDELGGGGAATCTEAIGQERGANGIYDLSNLKDLSFRKYFKIPRMQTDQEICVAHNGSLIPAQGRDIMVQSWYKGGVSIWDFTDSSNPVEIGYFDPKPTRFGPSGTWSTYYYNGYIYSSDGQQGLDVLQIDDERTDSAKGVHQSVFNAQTQYLLKPGSN
jgi:hypothetical protein